MGCSYNFQNIMKNLLHRFTVQNRIDGIRMSRILVIENAKNVGLGLLRNLIGNNCPYEWQIIHELMIDDDFTLSSDSLIIADPDIKDVIRFVIDILEKTKQSEFELAITDISRDDVNKDENWETVDTIFIKIKEMMFRITQTTEMDDHFDTDFVIQMIRGNVYTINQVINLIEHTCSHINKYIAIEHTSMTSWKNSAIVEIYDSTTPIDFFRVTAKVIFGLSEELNKVKLYQTNMKINAIKPIIRLMGVSYEKSNVVECVENKRLVLDRTTSWLVGARANLSLSDTLPVTYCNMVKIHREAMKTILYDASIKSINRLKVENLPETMAFDCNRINKIRHDIRAISIGMCLFTIGNTILSSIGVSPQGRDFKIEIFKWFDPSINSDELCDKVYTYLQSVVEGCQTLPVDTLELLLTCENREPDAIKSVLTNRILSLVVTSNDMIIPESLSIIEIELEGLHKDINNICSYSEEIHDQLYMGLLDHVCYM